MLLRWFSAAALLVALILGVGLVFYFFLGNVGPLALTVGLVSPLNRA